MNRLAKELHALMKLEYPEDVVRLRNEIPELDGVRLKTVESLYRRYSDDVWAACWLCGPDVQGFREWLLKDVAP